MSEALNIKFRDSEYIAFVRARLGNSELDDQSPSIHQELSVTWNMRRSNYSDTDINRVSPIIEQKEMLQFDSIQLPSSQPLDEIILSMTRDHRISESIPSRFHRCNLLEQHGDEVELLDLINKTCSAVKAMVASRRQKLYILMGFDEQVTVPYQQYEAMLEQEGAMRVSLDEEQEECRSKPATKASIEALEKKIFDNQLPETCVVCLEEMLSGCEGTRMPCSHEFHTYCTLKWLMIRHTCPVCRLELPTEDL